VDPARDVTVVAGVRVSKGSKVRLRPNRRADAQDLFFADQAATVTGVFADVDGETHVAVVLDDDPAAELHDWYGRYLYFAPDEVEPLTGGAMDTGPAQYRDEEPQSARGAPGSRDTGSDEPGGGPVDRPSGTSDAGEGTTIDPQEPIDDASPTLASGDQGG
ncbi:MAG: hypothetical protein ABJA87_09720, partial [bacterium]